MRRITLFLAGFLSVLLPLSGFDLREEMDAVTFAQSGLEKLTPEEMRSLNAAVAAMLGRQVADLRVAVKEEVRSEVEAEVRTAVEEELQIPKGDDRFGLETVKTRVSELFKRDAPEVIQSRILGDFRGWSGNTRFPLENGQIWRQTQASTFIVKVKDPEVTIRRAAFGSYLLKIEGFNSSVRVERIE